ncbi:MAG: FG-GAP repeat domain-containing protein [Geminicoccaceae bacterium]
MALKGVDTQRPVTEGLLLDPCFMTSASQHVQTQAQGVGGIISLDWRFQGVGDFNADGKTDLLFRGDGNATVGTFLIEDINAAAPGETGKMASTPVFFADPGAQWSVERLADFNGDGHTDILWLSQDGTPAIWLMNNNQIIAGVVEPNPTSYWSLVDAQDYNSDGKADILWRGAGGEVAQWLMDGLRIAGFGTTLPNPGSDWTLVGI